MKKEVLIKSTIALIVCGDNFAIFSRRLDENGFGKAYFSFPITAAVADRIEDSKIIQVEKISTDGTILYRRLSFYSMEQIIEVFMDIIEFFQGLSNEILHG